MRLTLPDLEKDDRVPRLECGIQTTRGTGSVEDAAYGKRQQTFTSTALRRAVSSRGVNLVVLVTATRNDGRLEVI